MTDTIVIRTRSMRKFFVAPSNGVRLSCGADLNCSQTEFYHTAFQDVHWVR